MNHSQYTLKTKKSIIEPINYPFKRVTSILNESGGRLAHDLEQFKKQSDDLIQKGPYGDPTGTDVSGCSGGNIKVANRAVADYPTEKAFPVLHNRRGSDHGAAGSAEKKK